jgi:KRAB domain-containing zinc finger protein
VDSRIAHETSTHRPWRCVCDMSFPTGPLYEEHQKGHRKFSCDVCSYTCKTKTMLRQHVGTHSNVKNHKCTVCSKAFTTPEYLAKHRARHERVRPYKFPCPRCVRALRTRPSLIKHMEKMHGEKPTYDCSFCGKMFGEAVYLARHERRHQKDKAIPCPRCNIFCRNDWQLRLHKKTHKADESAQPCTGAPSVSLPASPRLP